MEMSIFGDGNWAQFFVMEISASHGIMSVEATGLPIIDSRLLIFVKYYLMMEMSIFGDGNAQYLVMEMSIFCDGNIGKPRDYVYWGHKLTCIHNPFFSFLANGQPFVFKIKHIFLDFLCFARKLLCLLFPNLLTSSPHWEVDRSIFFLTFLTRVHRAVHLRGIYLQT